VAQYRLEKASHINGRKCEMAVAIWLNQLNILAVLISNGKWSVDWSYARGTGHLRGYDFGGWLIQEG
jgi:hypothetical protein